MNHPSTIVTLWSVVESMQRALEKQGLDIESVDAAVKRKVEVLLERGRGRRGPACGTLAAVKA